MNGLEALRSIRPCANVCGDYDPYCDIIEKELKALEVLKKKTVNVKLVKALGSLEEYNNMYADSRSKFPKLTQDEFDLLKEAME